jgi:SAM-dependent methyltransferase
MNDQYNLSIFNNPELWENYDSAGEIRAKVPLILEKIPDDVNSIIDVGCGSGEITNQFPEEMKVLGVDISEEALKHVTRDKICCSCDDIPEAGDQEYDMVFSSELIEHLPLGLMENTMAEFKRISAKYIFISVPNREQLDYYYIKCPSCSTVFHAYGHLNSFTVERISGLLGKEFTLLWDTTLGKKVKEYNPFLLRLRHSLAGKYLQPSQYTICPHCGNKEYPEHKGNLLSKLINGLNLILPSKQKSYWLMALYKRT